MSSDEIKSRSRTRFGAATEGYATSEVHSAGESLSILNELIVCQSTWNVLDVATGAGHTAFVIAPRVQSVIASDITAEMLEKTEELAVERGLSNVQTIHADAESLPFNDDQFDLVTCRLAHHHFPNPQKALDEMARVLKPGGWLGFSDNFTVDDEKAADFYNRYERIRDPSHFAVHSLATLSAFVKNAGLKVLQKKKISKEFEFQVWADRQHVVDKDKTILLQMMRDLPIELEGHFRPRWADGTMYFTLWEQVIVARKD